MIKYTTWLLMTLITVSWLADAATIRSVRCDHGFAKVGEDKYLVLENCGKPKYSEVTSGTQDPKKERLIYQFRSSGYLTAFNFENGKLVLIEEIKR